MSSKSNIVIHSGKSITHKEDSYYGKVHGPDKSEIQR